MHPLLFNQVKNHLMSIPVLQNRLKSIVSEKQVGQPFPYAILSWREVKVALPLGRGAKFGFSLLCLSQYRGDAEIMELGYELYQHLDGFSFETSHTPKKFYHIKMSVGEFNPKENENLRTCELKGHMFEVCH